MDLKEALDLTLKRIVDNQDKLTITIAEDIKDGSIKNFDRESFNGQNWLENKKPNGKKILEDSGRLKNDVRNAVRNGYKTGKDSYSLVVATPYAGYHQEGTSKLPQREFIGMTPEIDKKIITDITTLIDKAFKI